VFTKVSILLDLRKLLPIIGPKNIQPWMKSMMVTMNYPSFQLLESKGELSEHCPVVQHEDGY